MCSYYCLLLLLVMIGYGYTNLNKQPKIIISDGILTIESAENRNISFETRGSGYININGQNIVRITQMAFNASRTIQRIRNNIIRNMELSLNKFLKIIEGPHGLVERMNILELGGNTSEIIDPNSSSHQVMAINRKLNNLKRRLARLETSVSSVTRTLDENECSSNPCKNGGRCQDLFNDFMCICPDNWEGPLCDADVNECANFAGTDLGCQNGATCLNKPGNYDCLCTPGWYGIHCMRKVADCTSASSQELCAHGICISQQSTKGYSCICDQGWTTNGKDPSCTVDFDECASATPLCSKSPLVSCINVPGLFICGPCPTGYTGNGHYCVDVDECIEANNGGCSILPKVQCINIPGSRMCGSCPPGYSGDGVMCTQVSSVCQISNGGCYPLATCIDNVHISYTYVHCICPIGYTGQGIGPNGCTKDQSSPFVWNNTCASNPCLQGTCHPTSTGFNCECFYGFIGTLCNIRNPCSSNPCQNNGTCIHISAGDFTCLCSTIFTGKFCQIEQMACRGHFRTETGTLRFPMSNSITFDRSINCGWTIETNQSLIIKITFSQFHIGETTDCLNDSMQIYDGENSEARLIGRFCGTELPLGGTVKSSLNMLYLRIRSEMYVSNTGFVLKWESIKPECGGWIQVDSHGRLQSPGSPGNYPPNLDCEWTLSTLNGNRIKFHFFILDIGNNSDCNHDYLNITNPRDNSEIALFCQTMNPVPLTTPGSAARIHFHSDGEKSYAGFQITFSTVEGYTGCGGIFKKKSGEIRPPLQDGQYLPDLFCEYKIIMHGETRMKLTFIEMDIDESESCKYDFVSIMESDFFQKYCGDTLPPTYQSAGNEVLITFKSDSSISGAGFLLKYEKICDELFTNKNNFIIPPGYVDTPRNMNCVYTIRRPPGEVIILKLFKRNLDISKHCHDNYVQIWDGDMDNSNSMDSFCKMLNNEDVVISTHNIISIFFAAFETIRYNDFGAYYSSIDIGCGGVYRESIGIIQSPNEITDSLVNNQCKWIIIAPVGFNILLEWTSFNLIQTLNCSNVSVVVHNDDEINFMRLISMPNEIMTVDRYCGNNLPPTTLSSKNILTVVFENKPMQSSIGGFMASYKFIDTRNSCMVSYTEPTGTIRSPGYPQMYDSDENCTWIIRVPVGQQILLNFIEFEVGSNVMCHYNYLEVRNGGEDSSPLIGRYCDKNVPKTITSFTNELFLRFVSNEFNRKKRFLINWDGTNTGCGGILTSSTGHISSPSYPQPYPPNINCNWKIIVNTGSVIQVIFSDIDLEMKMGCRFDAVTIFDGLTLTRNPIGVYCTESQTSSIIRTNSNKMQIVFKSDKLVEGRGFNLKYITDCNTIIKGQYSGVIESPNFPYHYPDNSNCTWVISVPEGNKVHLIFSHMDLEYSNNENKICENDYITVKEGENNKSASMILGTFCSNIIPDPITSITNNVFIHFISNKDEYKYEGFRLEWMIKGCGGHLTYPTGELSTPDYPEHYPKSTICEWLIEVDYSHSVELTIEHIDIEHSTDCKSDSLTIFGGRDDTSPELSKLCNEAKDNYVLSSSGNTMFLRFKSDKMITSLGFKARYKSIPTSCGGKMTAPKGTITSRNYPMNYDHNDDCAWLIQVSETYIIELTFTDFDIESNKNCTDDYVQVHDGEDANGPILVKHCGNSLPMPSIFTSSSNKMFIRMKSDGSLSAKGFKAKYKLACGRRIATNSNGILNVKINNLEPNCTWVIESTVPGNHVSLTFTYVFLPMCSYGKVNNSAFCVYEGIDIENKIGCFCQKYIPPTITSAGSTLMIHTRMNVGEFTATYSIFDSACGGELSLLQGSFASIGYPNNYPPDADCVWTIIASEGNKLTLSFVTFDLEPSEDGKCNSDFVEVRETNSIGPIIGIFCGTDIPAQLTAINKIWIQFKSDSEGTAKGFMAQYSINFDVELSGMSGRIQTPLYPKYYSDSNEIHWRITVPFGRLINIKFNEFVMNTYVDHCVLSKLEIFDGFDANAGILARLCSNRLPKQVKSSSYVVYISFLPLRHVTSTLFDLEWTAVLKWSSQWYDLSEDYDFAITETDIEDKNCISNKVIPVNVLSKINFSSPGYPKGYDSDLHCVWIFSTNETEHLFIKFEIIDLEVYTNCEEDYITIYSGIDGTNDFEKVKTICYRNDSSLILRTSNVMKVEFITDDSLYKTGFLANVQAECGGSIRNSYGILEMTTDLQNIFRYQNKEVECHWNITVKPGKMIKITFKRFEIISSDPQHCENYILFKNGKYADSPLLHFGKYCGNSTFSLPLSTGNTISIKYFANKLSKGFKLVYEEVSQSCDKSIVLSSEQPYVNISSPNYPNIPNLYIECIWTFSAPQNEAIQVDFYDRFDLTRDKECKYEGVELRDGATRISPLINTFCNDLPSSQKTRGNYLFFRFYTNVLYPKNGFRANVSIARCGGTFRSTNGRIDMISNANTGGILSDSNCIWRLAAPDDYTIKLNFTQISLPTEDNCRSVSRIEISETYVTNDTEVVLNTLCGVYNKKIMEFATNDITVTFISGGKNQKNYKGFRLEFTFIKSECGGELVGTEGVFTSPKYPLSPNKEVNCKWIIVVPKDRIIQIEFLDLDFLTEDEIHEQGLSFYHSKYENKIHITDKFNSNMSVVKSTWNIMTVSYWTTNNFIHSRGFKAKYTSNEETVCDGTLIDRQGVIRLTNKLANFTSFYCMWQRDIQLDEINMNATMVFEIELKNSFNDYSIICEHSLSGIRVSVVSQNMIDEICHSTSKPYIIRTPFINSMVEVFKKQGNMNFSISYSMHLCGGFITASKSNITSPGYPDTYLPNMECAWLVTFEEGETIKMEFETLDLSKSCSTDFIAIYNGPVSKARY